MTVQTKMRQRRRPFETEHDVRDWCRSNLDLCLWIEPGRGGTVGLPDCLIEVDGKLALMELKCTAKLQPSQLRVFDTLAAAGVPVFILTGEKGTRTLRVTRFYADDHAEVLSAAHLYSYVRKYL